MIVVVLTPCFNLLSGIVDRKEPVFVQTLRAKTAVERFDKRIICGFPRTAEVESHFVGISPLVENLRSKFRTIVDSNRPGQRTIETNSSQSIDDISASKTLANNDPETLTSKVIDYR